VVKGSKGLLIPLGVAAGGRSGVRNRNRNYRYPILQEKKRKEKKNIP